MISHNRPTIGIEEEQAALRVLRSGWLAQGEEVRSLENEFCRFLGLPEGHAVAVSSGTAALYLALVTLEARGRQVAAPVYCCSAVTNALALSGGEPLFLDTAPGSPNVDPQLLTASGMAIAIVPHMFGLPVDLSGVSGTAVIEDCAQALGGVVKGAPVGLQGRIGVYSFGATKLMTSGGQGGMLVSRDRSLVDKARDYREFDCRRDRNARFNFQMTDLQAAVGRVQLAKLPGFLARRDEIFRAYRESGLELLDIPAAPDSAPVRYRGVMRCHASRRVIAALEAKGVRSIVPIEEWELLDEPERYPNASRLAGETVSLPLYPSLSDAELELVLSAVAPR